MRQQQNTLLPLPCLYVVYDFFYTILHWGLHIKSIYGYIHKHHHVQKAPRYVNYCVPDTWLLSPLCGLTNLTTCLYSISRANVDAVNVHPIEFFLGEYNHLLALFLCCNVLGLQIHIAGGILLLAVGGVLAGLNHTRYDVVISLFGLTLYDSKVHDVHHRIPQSNYGQYIMLWDHIFGSFR